MARRLSSMRAAWRCWNRDPVLILARDLAGQRGERLYAVGGLVRDALLGRPTHDYDLVVARGAGVIAAEIAARLGGRHVRLGGDDLASERVVLPAGIDLDLWEYAPGSLADDIVRRDFTLNAIFVDLDSGRWIDLVGGRADLGLGLLRRISVPSLRDDPLRLLRAVRLIAEIPRLRLEPGTRRDIRVLAPCLASAAAERRGAELSRILATRACGAAMALCAQLRLLGPLFSAADTAEGVSLRADLAPPQDFAPRTNLAVPRGRAPRPDLAALARLDHLRPRTDAGGEEILVAKWALVVAGFRNSAEARRCLGGFGVARARLLPALAIAAALFSCERWRRRGVSDARLLLMLRDLGVHASAARRAAQAALGRKPGAAALLSRLSRLHRQHAERLAAPPRWIGGDEVMAELGIPPGPALGKLLARLADAVATGAVTSRDDAWRFLRQRAAAPST